MLSEDPNSLKQQDFICLINLVLLKQPFMATTTTKTSIVSQFQQSLKLRVEVNSSTARRLISDIQNASFQSLLPKGRKRFTGLSDNVEADIQMMPTDFPLLSYLVNQTIILSHFLGQLNYGDDVPTDICYFLTQLRTAGRLYLLCTQPSFPFLIHFKRS